MKQTLRSMKAVAFGLGLALATVGVLRADDAGLTVFDWAGWEVDDAHPAYVAKYGSSPTFAFFADEEEAFQKLRAGFKADVAHPCSQSVVKWREAGLLEPLDTSKLENWNDILPGFKAMKNLMTDDSGKAWFIPFEWGVTAVLYRADKVSDADMKSLQAFADPKFKGKISIGDNVDDAYALASLAIGLKDWATMTDEQFKAASAFLRKVHQNVRFYWTDNAGLTQAMQSGEVQIAWAWNETRTGLEQQGVKVGFKQDTDEGHSTWVCGYVHLKGGAGDDEKVYDFLNAVSAPAVGPYVVSAWGYGFGNAKGMAVADAAALKAGGFDDMNKFVDKTLFQAPVPSELKQKMIAEFEKIKAGY